MASIASVLREITNNNTAKTFQFNAQEAQKARDFQETMSNSAHQREVADLKEAGLNPVLSSGGSGAQSYSTSSASGSADTSAVSALASIYQAKMNNDNAVKIARINANTSKEVARIQAAANNYSADQSYTASVYGTDRSKYGMLYNFGSGLTGNSASSLGKKGNSLIMNLYNRFRNTNTQRSTQR